VLAAIRLLLTPRSPGQGPVAGASRFTWPGRVFAAYLRGCAWLVLRTRRPYVIGVTGSVGKSTTVHVITSLLAEAGVGSGRPVAGTTENLNDDQGVPLTVLGYRSWPVTAAERMRAVRDAPLRAAALVFGRACPAVLVVECCAAPTSRMASLARLIRPQMAVVTTIESVHLNSTIRPLPRRLERTDVADLTIIDDTHNASAASVKLALDTLVTAADTGRRRVAVLSAMIQQGPRERALHREIGRYAKERADFVIGIGELARLYEPDVWFPDVESCAAPLPSLVAPGDVVLLKGAGSMYMTRLAAVLRESRPAPRPASARVDALRAE